MTTDQNVNPNSKNPDFQQSGWNPIRLSGKIKFRTKAAMVLPSDPGMAAIEPGYFETEAMNPLNRYNRGYYFQFHDYCQHTTLHGFRYITEKKRSLSERIFWGSWCLFGIAGAIYMMSKTWSKWQNNPVLTSIATTSLPVSAINFPAVTICPVNKAISEKLIIQGCRHNLTFSTMKKIISGLVDPESKNNDNDPSISNSIDAKLAMRYLRLVSPKCEDYILRCELNGHKPPCTELFKLVLTDTGYCCVFNALESMNQTGISRHNSTELSTQEHEFELLQKAVWQYHDKYRKIFGNPDDDNSTKLPTDSLTCFRVYDDDLFPGICNHIHKCKADPAACKLPPLPSPTHNGDHDSHHGSNGNGHHHHHPGKEDGGDTVFRSPGAGRSRGLTIMTDTLRCGDVPTDSFKGLRVHVHGSDEFPAVGERGFVVGPGQETQVGVTAIDAYSSDALRIFKKENRQCVFSEEMKLAYSKEYSRSSCVIECEDYLVHKECSCVPYYSPAASKYPICGMKQILDCVERTLDEIQQRDTKTPGPSAVDMSQKPIATTGPGSSLFEFGEVKEEKEKSCVDVCLPACNETFYNIVVTSAPFPNQNDPNKTKLLKEAIADGFENLADINYVSGSISLLRIFFRESTIVQYKRDELFTWEDFISNLGGVMSLCLGFSLLSLIEVFYFFTMRQVVLRRKRKKELEEMSSYILPTISTKSNKLEGLKTMLFGKRGNNLSGAN